MKKIIGLLLTAVMLVGCLSVFTACAPKDGGAQISVYLGNEVLDFDPSDYYADSTADQLMSLLYEPLFTLDEKGKLKKAGAKNYSVDEEERTIVIELRETYWSDDTRVTANDYVYAWRDRILDPNSPNPAAALFYEIENAAAVKSGNGSVSDIGVYASETYELTIVYREGGDYEQLLRNLASVAASPVRQDVVAASPAYWSKLVNTMTFNGPFKIKTFDIDTGSFTLGRNLGYHQDPDKKDYDNKVNPDELNATFTVAGEEVAVSYSDLEDKTVFYMTDASVADRAEYKDKAEVYDDTSVYTYVFNTTNELFAITEVRRALSLAIDRNAIAEAIVFGKAADGFLPDICGGSSDALISTSADIAAAQQLLAGVDLSGVSKSFKLSVADDEESLLIASLVEAAWEQLGFNVTVEPVGTVKSVVLENEIADSGIQWLVKEASYGHYDFDVLAVDWQLYSTDPFVGLSAFSSTIGGGGYDVPSNATRKNISAWVSSSYDALLNSAFKSSAEAREKNLADAEALLCSELPVCPIVFNQTFSFEAKGISGVDVDGFGNLVFTDMKQKNYRKYLED